MKNRAFRYITRPNITSLCLVAFNSTPFNAFASSGHKSIFFILRIGLVFLTPTHQYKIAQGPVAEL